METLRNGFQWRKWISFLLLACAVVAYRTLDKPGYTRQFIVRIDHDCRDFKGVVNKCHVWKDLGFCFKFRREMQHVCNRTCQYCVPGQKQWQVVDRVWGRVKEPAGQTVSAHDNDLAAPVMQHKEPAIQILGKERAPQIETAASAIATQLEKGVDQDNIVLALPSVLGQLPKLRAGSQSTLGPAHTKSVTRNETEGKLLLPQPSPSAAVDHDHSSKSVSRQASLSGKTKVRESSKENRPVVVLMGYELGEKSSKKVHDVLKNADSSELSESQSMTTSVPQRPHDYGILALGGNRVHQEASNSTAPTTTKNVASEDNKADSELEKVAEFLDNATTTGKHLHNKQQMHEAKIKLNVGANTFHSKLHAADSQVTSAFRNTTMQKERFQSQAESILPISSDDIVNQQAIERMKTSYSRTHYKGSDMHERPYQSITNGNLMQSSLGGMQAIGLSGIMMNAPLQKPKPPESSVKQVTVTFNEKPDTEETLKKEYPPPNYFHAKEDEEGIGKSEEGKIRVATQAIKNVLKLFDNGYRHDREKFKLVTQAAKDLPAHSKSLEINHELAGIQREIDTQTQNQDRAAGNAQALSRQIGQELTVSGGGNRVTNVPNYAVISTKGSKDWKNLAHVLAVQLKGVLNHMEDREKENQYEKDRMEEEMMMMARQHEMEGDEDEDPGYDDDDDEDDMSERRHSVLMPLATNRPENASKKFNLKNKQSHKLKSERNATEKQLLHQDVKKLFKLEMLHKSQRQRKSPDLR